MKNAFTLFVFALFAGSLLFTRQVSAQAPEKMSYQAVIRDCENQLVVNTEIGMQISILQSSIYGASVYVEIQTRKTNKNGLVSIEIGEGNIVNGIFAAIDWSDGP